ncbi:MAG: AbrB/MazE/SpoVT family DNA-binding domain-containing protein [Egibacteraceae bacterium]
MVEVRVGPKGRVVIPAAVRQVLGIDEGAVLVARVEGDELVLTSRAVVKRRLREMFADAPGSMAEDLIAERREEARREVQE